ncbi:MAG: hypothetical protein L0215_22950 [Gemmataceae bacterium]|nr:hypothetical protein [Gemmataceae bacterium]
MPAIRRMEALERLAKAVEKASADDLVEVFAELFPAKAIPLAGPVARELAQHIRTSLEPEEVVDLWNVVFPADRNVYYDEESEALCYDEKELRYAEQ